MKFRDRLAGQTYWHATRPKSKQSCGTNLSLDKHFDKLRSNSQVFSTSSHPTKLERFSIANFSGKSNVKLGGSLPDWREGCKLDKSFVCDVFFSSNSICSENVFLSNAVLVNVILVYVILENCIVMNDILLNVILLNCFLMIIIFMTVIMLHAILLISFC
jgi:hypothetical protein